MSSRKNRGFTLVEILIVVIILGILAAIVIPQFTNASQDARKSSVSSQLQTIRSQVELYKLQHKDVLPDLVTNWDQLTKKSDEDGSTTATTTPFGPYLQAVPTNSLNSLSSVVNGTANSTTECGFVYDYGTGATAGKGTGKVWATDTDKKTLLAY